MQADKYIHMCVSVRVFERERERERFTYLETATYLRLQNVYDIDIADK